MFFQSSFPLFTLYPSFFSPLQQTPVPGVQGAIPLLYSRLSSFTVYAPAAELSHRHSSLSGQPTLITITQRHFAAKFISNGYTKPANANLSCQTTFFSSRFFFIERRSICNLISPHSIRRRIRTNYIDTISLSPFCHIRATIATALLNSSFPRLV